MLRRILLTLFSAWSLTGIGAAAPVSPAPAGLPAIPLIEPTAPAGQDLYAEFEPNGTSGLSVPLPSTDMVAFGNIYPAGDVDYYSFVGVAGDRLFAALMTSSAAGITDSTLTVIAPNGTTVVETDVDDGSFAFDSAGVAGVYLLTNGTYYLRVEAASAGATIRPYHLHVRVQTDVALIETEPNNSQFTPQPLPAAGYIFGEITGTVDVDVFSIDLSAGDTLYVSLDLDPERNTTPWDGQLSIGSFSGFSLLINDTSAPSLFDPPSESHFMTVKHAGTYNIVVDDPTGGSTFGTYLLSVSVHPPADPPGFPCSTTASTDVPKVIPSGPGVISSTLTIPPGQSYIGDLDVSIELTHAVMVDLDVSLISPDGNEVVLFADVGNFSQGDPNVIMDLTLDDEAAIPIGEFQVVNDIVYMPAPYSRLSWFDGQEAGGDWTLVVRDDASQDAGLLQGWSLKVCEYPILTPDCPPDTSQIVILELFEAGPAGYTHSGTEDEWEFGEPTGVPISGCSSGETCWKTDLNAAYNPNSSQDLLSAPFDLTEYVGVAFVGWNQKYQLETASFDHAYVDLQEVGGANPVRLWEWLGPTMFVVDVGNPGQIVHESAGWSFQVADISDYIGKSVELVFHLDSDNSVNLGGLAIDDIVVATCQVDMPDLSNSAKTVNTTTASAGDTLTYTLAVYNTGQAPVTYNITDTLSANVTLVSAPGLNGTSTLTGTGSLGSFGQQLYLITVQIDETFSGTLNNSASLSGDGQTRTLNAQAVTVLGPPGNLAGSSKSVNTTNVKAGSLLTYTLTISNSGAGPATYRLTDTLSANVTLVSATGLNGTTTLTKTATLPSNTQSIFTIVVRVKDDFFGPLNNSAQLSGDGQTRTLTAPAVNVARVYRLRLPIAIWQ